MRKGEGKMKETSEEGRAAMAEGTTSDLQSICIFFVRILLL